MESAITQLGVGGVFVILALREIRAILAERIARKNGNGAGSSGAKPPEYWQAEMRKAAMEAFTMTAVPVLAQQTEVLRQIRDEQRKLSDEMLKMTSRQTGRGAEGW